MIDKYFNKIINILFSFMIMWIIILLLFFNNQFYPCKEYFILENIILVCFGSIFLMIIKLVKTKKNINVDNIIKVITIVFFIIQIYIFYNSFFIAGFDSGFVITPTAKEIINGVKITNSDYFSMYPNNLFLVTIYAFILKINSIFNIFSGPYQLMSIVVINCIVSSLTSYLIFKIGKKLFGTKIALVGYLISLLIIVFSPWNIVCYSDSFGLFIPILIFYLYINNWNNNVLKYCLIFILTYIGYLIKPQTVIISIAIFCVEFIKLFEYIDKSKIKKGFIILFVSICAIIPLKFCLNTVYKLEGFELKKERKIGLTHFLMMGVNPETYGVYSSSDYEFSSAISKKEVRREKNIQIYKERMSNHTVGSYFKFLSKKILINYNDGTFAFGKEGNFIYKIIKNDSIVSRVFKSIYYPKRKLYKYWAITQQFIWINMLTIIGIYSIINIFNKRKNDYMYLILMITIIGITIFELLFEARARYLYTNLPIFIILFLYSIYNISKKI